MDFLIFYKHTVTWKVINCHFSVTYDIRLSKKFCSAELRIKFIVIFIVTFAISR